MTPPEELSASVAMTDSALLRTKLLAAWTSRNAERAATGLALAASAALFLDSAATFQAVYTVRPSYILFAAALVVGAPSVVRGWAMLPRGVRWSAAAVLATYVAAAAFGHPAVLPNAARAGSSRTLLYVSYLVMGLGVLGLVVGLWGGRDVRPLLIALAAGATVAAAYGVYQWFAQHYGWPLRNVDNVAASNGLAANSSQGVGLFGWERVRGSFLEPHFLGAYLAGLVPLVAALSIWGRRRLRIIAAMATAICLVAIVLTDSVPTWAALGVGVLVAFLVYALSTRRRKLAAVAAVLTVGAVLGGPLLLIHPQSLASLTGRNPAQLSLSAHARTDTWNAAIKIWSHRPVLGYGPGQASVQLTRKLQGPGARLLGSAQGVWAAFLIDAGALGLISLVLLLAAAWITSFRGTLASSSSLRLPALCGVTTAIIAFQFTDDRLELWVWALLGLLLASVLEPAVRSGRPSEPPLSPPAVAPRDQAGSLPV